MSRSKSRFLRSKLKRLRFLGRIALHIEHFLTAFWSLPFIVLFYVGSHLLAFRHLDNQYIDITLFFIFLVIVFIATYRGISTFKSNNINNDYIERRLEKRNKLAHRPLDFIKDTPYNATKAKTKELWNRYSQKQQHIISRLKMLWPNISISHFDRYAFRVAATLILVLGITTTGKDWATHSHYALFPFQTTLNVNKTPDVQLLITPPSYTGLSKISIAGSKLNTPIDIPENSQVKITVLDGFGVPNLVMGEQTHPLNKFGEHSFGIETTIQPGEALIVKQFLRTRAKWPYAYIKDNPPELSWNGKVKQEQNSQIELDFETIDDYGVKLTHLEVTLNENAGDGPKFAKKETITKPIVTGANTPIDLEQLYDLTHHLWSGLPVDITLTVEDHAGQKTSVSSNNFTLPERIFNHELAKQLIETRKDIAWTPIEGLTKAEEIIRPYIFQSPPQIDDPIAYLALASAYHRIKNYKSLKTAEEMIDLLWDIAIRLEDGGLTTSRKDLSQAIQDLLDSLNDPSADESRLAQKYDEFQQALNDYLQKLQKALEDKLNSQALKDVPRELLKNMAKPKDLGEFMQELLEDLANGDKDSAFDKLSRLEDFLNNLNPSLKSPLPLKMQFNAESVNELELLIGEQEKLLTQTKAQILAQENELPFDTKSKEALEQEGLRLVLGEILRKAGELLDEIPQNLMDAELAMREAVRLLKENDPKSAVGSQELALRKLKEAQQDLQQQFQMQLTQLYLMGKKPSGQRDPLGREYGQNGNEKLQEDGVDLPEEALRKRVESILKELRKRSGDYSRPTEELDYLRRLLKRF